MDGISMDAMRMQNAQMSMQVDTAVLKKVMDQAVDQNRQLLESMPKVPAQPGLGSLLDIRV
ncbi:MAG TPA: YjfB family protein [Thermotogota bacterium]|nr:YjfB family protein [Thermotogota bacterium]HRW91939.1 YjfB family protein [Thermotogota bacterium]